MPLFSPPFPAISYRSTYWYYPFGYAGTAAGLTLNQLTLAPLRIEAPHAFDRIGLEVTVAGGSSSHTRLGIYGDANGVPNNLVLDAGVIPSSCAAGTSTITITQSLGPGIFWLGAVAQDGVAPSARVAQGADPLLGLSTVVQQFASGYFQTGVTGSLPATFTANTDTGNTPAVMLRSQ